MIAVAFLIITAIFLTARYQYIKKQYEQEEVALASKKAESIMQKIRDPKSEKDLQNKLDGAVKELEKYKNADKFAPTLSPIAQRMYEKYGKKNIP